MNIKRSLVASGVIGVLAVLSAGYCFWLMTVPLSYDLVYVVVIGFLVSLVVALICSIIFAFRLRAYRRAMRNASNAPPTQSGTGAA